MLPAGRGFTQEWVSAFFGGVCRPENPDTPMSTDTLDTYRHSGKFTVQGLLLPVAAAAVVGFPLGLAYAYLVRWIPFIYVNVLVTFGYAFAFGWLTTRLLKTGRVRNTVLAATAGLVAGVLAVYWDWNGHVHVLFEDSPWFFLPGQILAAMGYLYDHGSWTIGHGGSPGDTVSGIPLAIVWVVEAGIIIGIAAYLPFKFVADTPYCETTGTWLDVTKNIDTLDSIDDPAQVALLKGGSLQPLLEAKARPVGSLIFTRLCLKRSAQPGPFCTLRVQKITIKIDKKGKSQETVKAYSGDLILPLSMFDLIAQFEDFKSTGNTRPGNAPAGAG